MDDPNDDDFIQFQISDWDLDFSQGNSKSKRISKNKAIYGVWADSDSDDDDDDDDDYNDDDDDNDNGFQKKNYTASVSFVKSDTKLQDEIKGGNDNDLETKSKKVKRPISQFASSSSITDVEFGQWEMYTKGVGSKLLQKMGYQPGKGLGKNLQGIIEPIEAKKRPGVGSIGLYGPESTSQKPRKGNEGQINYVEKFEKKWKRKNETTTQTVKVHTKSIEEILKESLNKSWNNENKLTTKIIDMTGPKQRILTGISQLEVSKPERPKTDYEVNSFNTRFDIPELKQNIERLISLLERNLIKRKHEYNYNSNNRDNLSEEKEELEKFLKIQNEQLKNVELLANFVESLEEYQESENKLTFEKGLEMFENFFTDDLKKQLPKQLKIDNLILYMFNQILRQELRIWHPFDDLAYDYSHLFERLKNLIMKNKYYEILLWNHWNPTVCRALQSWPSMKNFEPIIAFINKWRPLLPKWLYEHFVFNNLIPKLKSEVEEWNPLTDVVSIHSWIHPWLPVILVSKEDEELSFLFEPIYEIIRMKLSNALINWHPSDSSARLILEPWKNVFNEASLQTFLDVNIVPKLEQSMRSLTINPNQQSINEWNWVISWKSLISFNTIVSILERFFFPKWLNVLYVWLNSGVANFNEISSWYQGWKTLMGDELVNHTTVKEFLKKALIMMDHAVNLNTGLKSFTSYYNSSGPPMVPVETINSPNPFNQIQSNMQAMNLLNEQINFRQMIEMKAAENGILFMPIANRYEEGRQVFKFGQYLIYIDNQVIFYQKYVQGKRIWQPIRITDLVELISTT